MSVWYQVAITLNGQTLAAGVNRAARAGIEIKESKHECVHSTALDGVEYRHIGALGFPADGPPKLWQRIGCTTSDTAALLNFAATHARGGLAQFPRKAWAAITDVTKGVHLSRPLTDYGNDLHFIVAIPETVPVNLLQGVDSLHTPG